ncbi:MAG: HD domain-containing protein [bacterium]|nr:MAG: HD domain-containing protein [bacterium]
MKINSTEKITSPPVVEDFPGVFGKRRSRFSLSMKWKVALSFSLLFLLLTAVISSAVIRFEWLFLNRESEKRVQSMARNLAVNSRDPLLAMDELRLAPVVESIMKDPDVRHAFIADRSGRIVFHSETKMIGQVLPEGIPAAAGGILQAAVPMEEGGIHVGTAVVGLGKDHINEALRQTLLGLVVPLLLGVSFGIAGIFALTGLHVRRIDRLAEAVHALYAGNLFIQVDDPSKDEVGSLVRHYNEMVLQLNRVRRKAFRSLTEAISALAAAVEARDAYTRGHCERVARISVAIAERMGANESLLRDLRLASILHDIGKIGVREGVLGKLGPLDPTENRYIQSHPEIGARILEPLSSMSRVALFIKHHHEWYDGSGYPSGLKGDAIPMPSRIVNLVDAFDAMTSDRCYRSALSREEALRRIRKARGIQFDPAVVETFLKLEADGEIDRICREIDEDSLMSA